MLKWCEVVYVGVTIYRRIRGIGYLFVAVEEEVVAFRQPNSRIDFLIILSSSVDFG